MHECLLSNVLAGLSVIFGIYFISTLRVSVVAIYTRSVAVTTLCWCRRIARVQLHEGPRWTHVRPHDSSSPGRLITLTPRRLDASSPRHRIMQRSHSTWVLSASGRHMHLRSRAGAHLFKLNALVLMGVPLVVPPRGCVVVVMWLMMMSAPRSSTPPCFTT